MTAQTNTTTTHFTLAHVYTHDCGRITYKAITWSGKELPEHLQTYVKVPAYAWAMVK